MINRKKELNTVAGLLRQHRVSGIIGARQVGKSTLVQTYLSNISTPSHVFDPENSEHEARLADPSGAEGSKTESCPFPDTGKCLAGTPEAKLASGSNKPWPNAISVISGLISFICVMTDIPPLLWFTMIYYLLISRVLFRPGSQPLIVLDFPVCCLQLFLAHIGGTG
jgi:hypothetical protein